MGMKDLQWRSFLHRSNVRSQILCNSLLGVSSKGCDQVKLAINNILYVFYHIKSKQYNSTILINCVKILFLFYITIFCLFGTYLIFTQQWGQAFIKWTIKVSQKVIWTSGTWICQWEKHKCVPVSPAFVQITLTTAAVKWQKARQPPNWKLDQYKLLS